jgi:iron complex outermembrane recepter protein
VDRMSGVDLNAQYALDAFNGQLAFSLNTSWIDADRELTAASPEVQTAGSVFFPAKFKGRFGTRWSHGGLSLSGYLNYIDGVRNNLVAGDVKGSSMTTFDLTADYQITTGPLEGLGINVSAINLLDKEPPTLQAAFPFFVPYDSTNYSALGQIINITATKRF